MCSGHFYYFPCIYTIDYVAVGAAIVCGTLMLLLVCCYHEDCILLPLGVVTISTVCYGKLYLKLNFLYFHRDWVKRPSALAESENI